MADDTAEVPVWGYEIKDYINIGSAETANWQEITHLISWEYSNDADKYEPEYLEMKKSPTFVRAKSASVEYEKDLYKNNALDEFLTKNRNGMNIAVELVRVYPWMLDTEKPVADKAAFLLTPNALGKGSAGEPGKLTGTLEMSDADWTEGTWDAGTKAFTAKVG